MSIEKKKKREEITIEEIKEAKLEFDKYFDEDFVRNVNEKVLYFLNDKYFRTEFKGFDKLPVRNKPDTPLIYITNHSGMAFPWDAVMFGSQLIRNTDYDYGTFRALAAPMLSKSRLMNPYMLSDMWKKSGAIDATFVNFEASMYTNGPDVLIYPEGVPGIGKGFNRKYQLQRFATSYVRMSIKYQTDVIPFVTVNGEYINPFSYKIDAIDRFFQKFGIPFFPLSILTLLMFFQPWIFYLAFPAKLIFVKGKAIKPYKMIDKPYEEITDQEFEEVSLKVKKKTQDLLDDSVKKYGKKPYDFKELFKIFIKNFFLLPLILPSGWPLLFAEFERQYVKKGAKDVNIKIRFWTFIQFFLQNLFVIFYFIPILGWIPIAIKGYRDNKIKK